ncbi:MAG: GFA family protein [Oleispira sp.]|nr:GFA family protein [Oleispira sp.]MBL4881876.1 GFA family protein [Oleispira sp.]
MEYPIQTEHLRATQIKITKGGYIKMFEGECLCGSVKYDVNEPISIVECCHCLLCRKAHSSAFAMGVTIKRSSFKLIRGDEQLAEFESSPGKFRMFCKKCGSHLYAYRPSCILDIRLRPALLNTDLSKFKIEHINIENRFCI